VLSALQQRLTGVIAELPEAESFALAGGAALILQGFPGRVTADLDYFATSAAAVDALLPVLEAALAARGLQAERLQVASGFARLEVSDGAEVCQIDLGYDYRLRAPDHTPLGPVLSAEELGADKTLAVHGRALARDYVDLHGLKKRFGADQLLGWAAEKDPGFSLAVFAQRLDQIDRLPRGDFSMSDDAYAAMRLDLSDWSRQLRVDLRMDSPAFKRDHGVEPPGIDL
jgi:hypothetical protein